MRGSGSRCLMANPQAGDKCANAHSAMRTWAAQQSLVTTVIARAAWLGDIVFQRHSRGAGDLSRSRSELDHPVKPGDPVVGRLGSPRHFGLSAALFLQSDMNFLRSLPWTPLVSASLEHSSDAAVRGFSAFFAGGLGAVFAAGAGVAGAVPCANAELISS